MTSAAFHGRGQELSALEDGFAAHRSELWVVYGRRRVGKTALLEHFAADKNAFFFTAGVENSRTQMRRFIDELSAHAAQPLYESVKPSSWSDALLALANHIERVDEKILVVLDEFQWMCRGTSGVLSDIQRLWDQQWKRSGKVQLVLCGSAVSFMVGEVLAQKSPLFGRRTASIHLEPLSASEAVPFLSHRGRFEQAEALITLGGIPAYLEHFAAQPSKSTRQVIDRLAFQASGYLTDEINFIFSEQLDRTEHYREIVALLAGQPCTLADISRRLQLNPGQTTFYMRRLLLLGLVDKHRPITMPQTSKTVRYRLRDEYLRFYFHFVEPNLTRIRNGKGGYNFDRFTRDRWDVFLGLGFEHFVERNLERVIDRVGASETVSKTGSYWHKSTAARAGLQIDLVIERDDNVTHLLECKWSRKQIGKGILAELNRKCELYPNPKQHTLCPVLVAANGATRAVLDAGVTVLSLSDLFSTSGALL